MNKKRNIIDQIDDDLNEATDILNEEHFYENGCRFEKE
jgi:hypothetical protein